MKVDVAEVRAGPLRGTAQMPGSKSVTHRAFLLAALSETPCTIERPLLSADTRATLDGLHRLGARVHLDNARAESVQFIPARLRPTGQALDCANSGTTLRLLAGLTARFAAPSVLTGDASLRSRPNAPLLAALRSLGARATGVGEDGNAPLSIQGPVHSGLVGLPAKSSSQFASSLLLSLPFLQGDSQLHLEAPVASRPYLEITLDLAARFGLRIEGTETNGVTFHVPGGQQPRADRVTIEGDWSSAAFLLVAAVIAGGEVTAKGASATSRQGDRAIVVHLRRFGAVVEESAEDVTARGGQTLTSPGEVDVMATPDLFPALAVLAACSKGTTTFTGGEALRSKESDRIAAMAAGLAQMGITCNETPGGLVVRGGGPLRGATVASHGDHRIHMAFVVAGLAASGLTVVDGASSAAVSFPGFHAALRRLGGRVELVRGDRQEVMR